MFTNLNPRSQRTLTHPLSVLAGALLLLCIIRIGFTFQIGYLFLVWNLFLAVLPLLWWNLLLRANASKWNHRRAAIAALALLWLLFLPNAAYLLTDFYHLNGDVLVNLRDSEARHVVDYGRGSSLYIFDSFLLLLGVLFGLLAGGKALLDCFLALKKKLSKLQSITVLSAIILLSSIGVYIGRFSRFNSWDVFTGPHKIIMDLVGIISSPNTLSHSLGIVASAILMHALSIYFVYVIRTRSH